MADAYLHFIRQFAEFKRADDVEQVPAKRRGIYALYKKRRMKKKDGKYHDFFDVVYVGMTTSGIRGRLDKHLKSERKNGLWTHFSAFEVWPNVPDAQVRELEGLFRHLYRLDNRANKLNRQRRYARAERVRQDDFTRAGFRFS